MALHIKCSTFLLNSAAASVPKQLASSCITVPEVAWTCAEITFKVH
jgi:hypothetical protein